MHSKIPLPFWNSHLDWLQTGGIGVFSHQKFPSVVFEVKKKG